MQNEPEITTPATYNALTELKQELKDLIKQFPNRYGYAKKVVERLQKKGHAIEEVNVFNMVHSKTYYDKLIVNEIQLLHQEYITEINQSLSNLKAQKANAGSDHHAKN
ncbi:hypothetical protein [Runella slithyformis]|uniref:Uncharacterized protein n=1 Tax=Runella slithyformis (strain ATCC 29530 / DSM 19594 / LMG 11500 / NCIMB 11436 / LSU 4) TaxID=761193 RepID=A0A7U4E7C6_RUNSL|nr:hypothetical protein [Runella slithyformis]AEI50244.1 hypothetical protein Runsl_3887 [Runella slithyformis DSM 19594]